MLLNLVDCSCTDKMYFDLKMDEINKKIQIKNGKRWIYNV